MTHILLHKRHGIRDWVLEKEGTARDIQAYLETIGCRNLSHFRAIEVHEIPIVSTSGVPTEFYLPGGHSPP